MKRFASWLVVALACGVAHSETVVKGSVDDFLRSAPKFADRAKGSYFIKAPVALGSNLVFNASDRKLDIKILVDGKWLPSSIGSGLALSIQTKQLRVSWKSADDSKSEQEYKLDERKLYWLAVDPKTRNLVLHQIR